MFLSTHRSFNALVHTTIIATVLGGSTVLATGDRAVPHGTPLGEIIVFNDNGGWSWFEDERAVVDPATATILVSSVASADGSDGAVRHGNVEVVAHHLPSGSNERTVLHPNLQADDHNSAALQVLPNGRYLAMYSTHASDTLTRWRATQHPGPGSPWQPERTLDHDAPATYSNVYAAADRLRAFVRSAGRDPHILTLAEDGTTWERAGRLLDGPGRPYVRYAVDDFGRIHLITTEQHPHDHGTSIYHGIIIDDRLVRSDGTTIDTNLDDEHAVQPERLTTVYPGDTNHRAWTIDLQVDDIGHPYAAFSVRTRPTTSPNGIADVGNHDYYFARHDGTRWNVHHLAHAGTALYPDEADYTGLVALDPNDPDRLFISTNSDPLTGAPLISSTDHRRHHELFEGHTTDAGATWSWTPITTDSDLDNIRPIVPAWDHEHTALLWLRGTYTTYHHYDLDVVGIITATEIEQQ